SCLEGRRLVRVASLADAKHVPIRVAHMHLANAPCLIAWRLDYLDPFLRANGVRTINIVDPHGYPRSRTASSVVVPATTLPVEREKNLAITGSDSPEAGRSRWVAPIPFLVPPELVEPVEAPGKVGHIQDRDHE